MGETSSVFEAGMVSQETYNSALRDLEEERRKRLSLEQRHKDEILDLNNQMIVLEGTAKDWQEREREVRHAYDELQKMMNRPWWKKLFGVK